MTVAQWKVTLLRTLYGPINAEAKTFFCRLCFLFCTQFTSTMCQRSLLFAVTSPLPDVAVVVVVATSGRLHITADQVVIAVTITFAK